MKMSDDEFNKYLGNYWSFLMHGEGVWGGTPGTPIHSIASMDKKHLENSIAMIKRWNVKLPEDKADRDRVQEIKLYKLSELEKALERK
jgi:hypothetical protein